MGFHDLEMEGIDGSAVSFAQFEGKHTLCVNVASR